MKKKNIAIAGITCALVLTLFIYLAGITIRIYRKNKPFRNLKEEIFKEAERVNLEFSFVLKELRFLGAQIRISEDEKIPGASLMKLPILAVVFRAVKDKKISLDDMVTIRKSDITGGSGKLKKIKTPRSLTVRELLGLMITVSDNTATNKIISLLGFDYINDSFKKLGLKHTFLARKMMDFTKRRQGIENFTSAADTAYLLEAIYKKKLVSKDLSTLALSLLKGQRVNDRLPRHLPEGVVVAHKTGLEKGVVHDAGIIFTVHGDYIICLLVRGTNDYRQAKKFIAQVSLLAYNLYQDVRS